jgi:hypothetical protein
LRDASDALLGAQVTAALIRSAWFAARDGTTQVRDVWRGLAGIGLTGTLVPPESGGLGLDENALPPVLARLGYSGLPVPAVETVAVAAPLLAAAGHPALPDVLSGRALVAANLEATAADGLPVPFLMVSDYVLLRADGEVRLHERGEVDPTLVRTVDGSRRPLSPGRQSSATARSAIRPNTTCTCSLSGRGPSPQAGARPAGSAAAWRYRWSCVRKAAMRVDKGNGESVG